MRRPLLATARLLGIACMCAPLLLSPSASAQSPYPNATFIDWRPGNLHYTSRGDIVEGLGMYACSYSLSSVETATVDVLNANYPALTEISPQSGCASLSQYESAVSSLVTYVEGHASNASSRWAGIVLDEEPGFGFTVSQLESLNAYTDSKMSATPGVSYWFTDLGNSPGYWSQSQYNALTITSTYDANAAPQVYTSFQAQQANGLGYDYNMVTTWTGAPYPYDSASYAIGEIYGKPYYNAYGYSSGYYWTWPWQAQ